MKDERDDFWDIAKLLPERKGRLSAFSEGGKTRELDLTPSDAAPADRASLRLTGQGRTLRLLREYTPKDNPLILSVRIEEETEKNRAFAPFLRDAERYLGEEHDKVSYVPFFSYSPQYSQLKKEQLAYYLFWRRAFLSGEFQPLDKSYFFLFIYECIVLSGRALAPEEGLSRLLRAYEVYRQTIPEADRYLSVWIPDFCLLHALPCPALEEELLPFLLENAELKEFYLFSGDQGGEPSPARAFHTAPSYSLFREEDRSAARAVYSAAERGILRLLEKEGALSRGDPATLSRRAFYGSPCAAVVGMHLKLTYLPFYPEREVRNRGRAALRYAENHLRKLYGVKGRLSVSGLDPALTEPIDRFFASLRGQKSAERKKGAEPTYEALYEAEERGMDFSRAENIEAASWQLTRLLLPEEEAEALFTEEGESYPEESKSYSEKGESYPEEGESYPEESKSCSEKGESYSEERCPKEGESTQSAPIESESLDGGTAALLRALLKGSDAFILEAERQGLLPPLAAERVNELALERLGDIIAETDGDTFTLVSEYREDAEQWLN